MKKIIVAGAGHGGLCAAIRLAEQGYDVTVLERRQPEELGYDWHDAVPRRLFESAGLPEPPEGTLLPAERMAYYSTAKRIKKSWTISKAILQQGRTFVTKASLALQLYVAKT